MKQIATKEIDREQALAQLRMLGYQTGEKVYLTFFYPKDHPNQSGDRGRKLACTFPNLNWKQIQVYQDDGRGAYIVVNGGGHKVADIQTCKAFFYEHDDLDKAIQRDLWKSLNLPEPTLQVDSGGKSIHSYWVLNGTVPLRPAVWREIQTKLLDYADADRSLKNANRVMRLAGCWHTGSGEMSCLINYSETIYRASDIAICLPDDNEPPKQVAATQSAPLLKPLPGDTLGQFLHQQVYPQLKPDQVYSWPGHNWKYQSDTKWKGSCPFHESQTGTSFFIDFKPSANTWLWCCAGCGNIGGGPIEYLDRLNGGNGKPQGSRFRDLVEKLANIAGLQMPDYRPPTNPPMASTTGNAADIDADPDLDDEVCALARNFYRFKALVGNRLRLNILSKEMEFDGETIQPEDLELQLALAHNQQFKYLQQICKGVAMENQYSPIVEYLEKCHRQNGADTSILDNLAERYFGREEPIFNTFVKKWLIGAVARALDPGCKLDTALILQGKQGTRKSTWFKTLAGEQYFDDSFGSMGDKDERLKLHRAWIVEWAELETIFRRKDLSAVKAFLTSSTDMVRPPYGRAVESMPRHSVIVGSTNQEEFLTDTTGNRRFWVLPVKNPIDIDLLVTERDRIWGAAVAAYKSGEAWWLTKDEGRQAEDIAEEFQTLDPWTDPIRTWIENSLKNQVTTSEILDFCLKIETSKQSRGDQMRVAEVLKYLGWEQRHRKHDGKRQRVWILKSFAHFGCDGCDSPSEPSPSEDSSAYNPQKNVVTGRDGCDEDSETSNTESQPTQPKSEVVTKVVTPENVQKTILSDDNHNHHNLKPQKTKNSLEIGGWVFSPAGKTQVQAIYGDGNVAVGSSWDTAIVVKESEVSPCR